MAPDGAAVDSGTYLSLLLCPHPRQTYDARAYGEHAPRPPQRRGIYLLPNLITTGALFAGFYAIVAAIDGNFERAGVAVFVAMVFDGLDGRVARWTSTESAFGKEYDSLSDMVSFGLAPAIVTYQWGVARIAEYGVIWGRAGWLAAFFFAVAAALRLARFNTRTRLPTSASSRACRAPRPRRDRGGVRLVLERMARARAGGPDRRLRRHRARRCADGEPIRLLQLQGHQSRRAHPVSLFLLVPLAFALIAVKPPVMLFVLFSLYALSAPGWWLMRRLRRKPADVPAAGDGSQPQLFESHDEIVSSWHT